jgi:deoxyadenosine/deoxycytidine kinase
MHFIAIEGNIGSGKTTLVKQIAQHTASKIILEEFEDNPFLPLFYKNPSRYALQLELFFLAERYKQLNSLLSKPELFNEIIISDYYIEKSLLFARINLDENEYSLFTCIYEAMFNQMTKPDLLIYLHVETSELLKNIKARNRSYEQTIKEEYLLKIELLYKDYLTKNNKFKSVIIDCSKRHLYNFPDYTARIMEIINNSLKDDFNGNKYIYL